MSHTQGYSSAPTRARAPFNQPAEVTTTEETSEAIIDSDVAPDAPIAGLGAGGASGASAATATGH